ncbi:MAG TPA: serine/threonine protein kinase [Methanocella sp.]|nr:serine/threonine protein kinase [Methanocella sp.]
MSSASYGTERPFGRFADRFLRKAAYTVLRNRIVEALLVSLIAIGFLFTAIVDGILKTGVERRLINSLRKISRDQLNSLRKAQIRHIFRREYGMSKIKIRLAGGSYWLSIPCIVEGRKNRKHIKYMAKIINDTSELKHRYITMLRNIGGFAGASAIRFDEYADAKDMACFERSCLSRLREQQINAPAVAGMHRLNEDDYLLVTEFIDGIPLSKASIGLKEIDEMLSILKRMHDNGIIHGDIKLDNFLSAEGKIFVVDCLKIGHTPLNIALAFDLVCALCSLCIKTPVSNVMEAARRYFTEDELLRAGTMLDTAISKVDIDLPPGKINELRTELGNPL